MRSVVGIGGWRGWLGLIVITLVLGLAYASLLGTVLTQWAPPAGTPLGIALIVLCCCLLILIWLLGALLR